MDLLADHAARDRIPDDQMPQLLARLVESRRRENKQSAAACRSLRARGKYREAVRYYLMATCNR